MKNHSTKPPATQLELFQSTDFKQWERVRKVEIDNEMYFSVLDIFKFFGDGLNPSRDWKTTLNRMTEQGYSQTTDLVDYVFEGADGKKKKSTPVANLKAFFRIAQSTDFKQWELIRDYMAQAAKEKTESAKQRKQRETIEYMEGVGKGDVSGVVLLKAQYEMNRGWDVLKTEIFAKCDNPRMGIIVNKEYLAIFGMVADELKKELNTKSIRDNLPLRQVQVLTLAEGMLSDILARQAHVTEQQIFDAIQLAIVPIGQYLRGISAAMGVSPVTGKALLPSGK